VLNPPPLLFPRSGAVATMRKIIEYQYQFPNLNFFSFYSSE